MYETISLKSTLISLIESVDLFNFLLKHHQRRVTIIAYNLGLQLKLTQEELRDLVFAASLHDIGALTIEERDSLIAMEVDSPHEHEIVGCAMLRAFTPFSHIAHIIEHHHIRYCDVSSQSLSESIPRVCFVLHLADRIEISIDPHNTILSQNHSIMEQINIHNGSLFAPWCIEAFNELAETESFWLDIDYKSLDDILSKTDLSSMTIHFDAQNLEEMATTFSRIVDFRSRFTASHSVGVGAVASELGKIMALSNETCMKLKIAGLLHDIGKIAIPTEIINKNGPLDDIELSQIKSHSYYTYAILSKIDGLSDICSLASQHHEKLDGSGYPFHIHAQDFSLELEILAYSDIFTSLCEDRPYRQGKCIPEVLAILSSYTPHQLSAEIYYIIENNFQWLNNTRIKAQTSTQNYYHDFVESPLANFSKITL